ncbi:MAG: STAS/SEC14 domain-containing protein [Oligoflexales bacterium]|nr:STAS/SEC14 domain-containing protein [Oligoflexales bacterium]
MAKVCTRVDTIELADDGIVRVVVNRDGEVSLDDAKRAIAEISKMTEGRSVPVLIDLSGIKSICRDARNYFAGAEAARYVSASALLVSSPVSRIIGNFFIGINKHINPVQIFTSESDALDWLKGYLK